VQDLVPVPISIHGAEYTPGRAQGDPPWTHVD
jgi:hypothetical protein